MRAPPRTRRLTAALLATAALGACEREPAEPRTTRSYALGTTVELVTWGLDRQAAGEAEAAVTAVLADADARWDGWDADSDLGALNRALAGSGPAEAGAGLGPVLERARALGIASGGRFDPTLGHVVALWGFHREEAIPSEPPSAEAIAERLPRGPLAGRFEVHGDEVAVTDPNVRFDLGGFAKGLAVAAARDRLHALGVEAAIVNAGGDLCAWGRPGRRPWRIAIRQARGTGPLASLELPEATCVFSSGDYERYFEADGERYHHVLDPATGRPTRGVAAVTVIHPDPGLADAAATALMVAGPDDWLAVASALGIRTAMMVETSGRVRLTPAMARRVRFEAEDVATVVEGDG